MSLLTIRKKRYITEMAKNAQRRVFDKLTPEKQQMFLTAKAINEVITDRDSTATAMAKLKRFIEVNRFDWDAYVALIRSKLNIDLTSTSWYDFKRKFTESAYYKLYTRIGRAIEHSKDDIDRNYYDRGIKFHNQISRNNVQLADAYNELDMADFVEWFKNNEEEAKDRFGANSYRQLSRDLARWIMPDYSGSATELSDAWNDWVRAYKRDEINHVPEENRAKMDETVAYKLALFINDFPEDAMRLLANNDAEYMEQSVKKTIKDSLGAANFPTAAECRSFLNSDAQTYATQINEIIDSEIPNTIEIPRRDNDPFKLKAKQIVKKYFTDNPRLIRNGGVVGDAIGAASVEIVRAICQHALTRLNTRYKTDTDKPFVAHNLQEFYDTYKPVFKLGLTKECLEQVFEEFAKNFKENA